MPKIFQKDQPLTLIEYGSEKPTEVNFSKIANDLYSALANIIKA